MKTKKLTMTALLAALSLILFVIESRIPAFVAVPGIKIGLANVVTVFTFYYLGAKEAACVTLIKVVLGNVICGQITAILYSLGGAALSFAAILLFSRIIKKDNLWAVSVISACAHNLGQLIAASLVLATGAVFTYLPYLLIAAIIAGAFTGICAQLVLNRLK